MITIFPAMKTCHAALNTYYAFRAALNTYYVFRAALNTYYVFRATLNTYYGWFCRWKISAKKTALSSSAIPRLPRLPHKHRGEGPHSHGYFPAIYQDHR